MPFFKSSDGLNLHYTDTGTGLPVLCLAGLTRTTLDFDYVTPHLPECRLIKLDYRGRGESDWDQDWTNYTLQIEARDALELLDHLGVGSAAVLGTSRGGLIAMGLAASVPQRVLGVALNDIGPMIDPGGLDFIMGYLGRNPAAKTFEQAAGALKHVMVGFDNLPDARWQEEARRHFTQCPDGLQITYDPHLRDAVVAASATELPDLWPLFDALGNKPVACLRGANSNLLSPATLEEMNRRRPDMIAAQIPDRGHVPFLDEPQSLVALGTWLEKIQ